MTTTTEIDALIGARIKSRRAALKISQTALAEAIGVRFQQVQKYENGSNRVSAARLLSVAKALDVPVSYFFQGMTSGEDPHAQDTLGTKPLNALSNSNIAEILALVETLPDDQQQAVLAFLRTLSNTTRADATNVA